MSSRNDKKAAVLKDIQAGVPFEDVLVRNGISRATFFRWKATLPREESEIERLRRENAALLRENLLLKKTLSEKKRR